MPSTMGRQLFLIHLLSPNNVIGFIVVVVVVKRLRVRYIFTVVATVVTAVKRII